MKHILVSIFILLSCCLYSQNKDSLDIVKSELEIKKLNNELKYYDFNFYLKIAGGIFGGLGILWTVLAGFRTLKIQALTQKDGKISSAFELLTDESIDKRITGTILMSRYINETVDECLGILAIEDSFKVRNSLVTTLLKSNNKLVPKFIESNRNSLIELAILIGICELKGEQEQKIIEKLKISNVLFQFLKRSYKIQIENFKSKSIEISDDEFIMNLKSSINLLNGTSVVISDKIVNTRKINNLKSILLDSSNWYQQDIRNKNFDKVSFLNILGRYAKIIKIKFNDSLIANSNLILSKIYDSKILNSLILNTKLIEASIKNNTIKQTNITKCNFSKSSFENTLFSSVTFVDCNLSGIVMEKNTNFQSPKYDKYANWFSKRNDPLNKFGNCIIKGANFQKTNFINVVINGGELDASEFFECVFINIKFNGVSLRNVKMTDCSFKSCRFNGNELRGFELVKPKFENTEFYKCKNETLMKKGMEKVQQLTRGHK